MKNDLVDPNGTVHAPAFTLPFSSLASAEARAHFVELASNPRPDVSGLDIAETRKFWDDAFFLPLAARLNARYAVNKEPRVIAGVYTEVFTPKEGVAKENRDRVLINLHGGGFVIGGRSVGEIESVPMASRGRITVVSVDYRMAPEHRFPAASEDVAAVYKELLKTYEPGAIGIYGCSAGGVLAGEMIGWLQQEGLPRPGAIGVFCASLVTFGDGDSAILSPVLGGVMPTQPPETLGFAYFEGVDPRNPLAVPGVSPELLATFPPTLFMAGTRAAEFSGAAYSHVQLLKAGVESQFAAWDGLDHGFVNLDIQEAREAHAIAVQFFNKHLI